MLKRELRLKLRHRANIVAMYVFPFMRKTSIRRKLIATCIEKAKFLEEMEQVYLRVVTTNIAAKNLYLSLGLKSFSQEKRDLKLIHI
ncbi:GNAT family N-acetyltransferase [Priestia filamentosa]|uniref:GNAT family N-acetyltransferase n=1 Tax=Priestia filamentosa TaxID=1402861 RepID=UPI00398268BE